MEQDKQPVTPFYNRPMIDENGNTPLTMHYASEEPPNTFAKAAKILGIIALVSVFTFTVYPPLILGSLSIILALLSRGGSLRFHTSAKNGIQTALLALGMNIFLFAGSVALILNFFEEYDTTFQEIYGMSYEEMMESMQNGTFDSKEYYENIYDYMFE